MSLKEYWYNETDFKVTEQMKEGFRQNGYIFVKQLLDSEEIGRVKQALESENSIWENSFGIQGKDGKLSRLCIWSNPGDDVTGMVARCDKVAGTCEQLLGGEVYHYHSKLMMKEAEKGGKFFWHQDYGYWYQNGNLFPDMMTAFIAVDPCTPENGCLQEMFCFFHCNVLHASGPNLSPHRRWALLVAFNCKSNNPIREHQHPRYRPLARVPNSSIRQAPLTLADMSVKEFMDPAKSKTLSQIIKEKH